MNNEFFFYFLNRRRWSDFVPQISRDKNWETPSYFIVYTEALCNIIIKEKFHGLLVPNDNSDLANEVEKGASRFSTEVFSTPFSNLKFEIWEPPAENFASSHYLIIKGTKKVKKNFTISEGEIINKSFSPISSCLFTFKVVNNKTNIIFPEDVNFYEHELEIEPVDLGIEGLPKITKIKFAFTPPVLYFRDILLLQSENPKKTCSYVSSILSQSAGKTFLLKVIEWILETEKENNGITLQFIDSENFELDSFEEVVEIKNDNRKENDKRSSEIIPPQLITEENLTEEPPTPGTTKNNLESQKVAAVKNKQQPPTKLTEIITEPENIPQDNQKSPVLPQQPQIEKTRTLQSTEQPEVKKKKKIFIFLGIFLVTLLAIGLIIKYMNYLDKEEKERKKIECQKIAGKAVAKIFQQLKKEIKIGNTGKNLEEIAKKLMEKSQVKSSSFGYRDFPAYICVSLNNELTHGIPDPRPFQNGDLVSIDVACSYQGYHADAALTVIIGEGDKKKKDLLKVTKNSLYYAIQNIQPNITTTQDIGTMLEKYIRSRGYYPIKEYGGHGIGECLHEEPFIPNYKIPNKGKVIREGMTICIEPLVQIGDNKISLSTNKWTVFSPNGYLNAHFEHTIYITRNGTEILTDYEK